MECSICYEAINKETGKAELSCSHSFHLACLSKWFIKNESCPCCRHEANDTEKMGNKVQAEESEEEEDDDSDDSDDDEDEDTIEVAAAKERARHHFRLKRWDMKKADFEAYAATRISALIRGVQSRKFFFELRCWKEDEKDAKIAVEQAEKDLKQAKAAQVFYKKAASKGTSSHWKTFAATMIQANWRAKKQQKVYENEHLSRALKSGLRINWAHDEDGAWKRSIDYPLRPHLTTYDRVRLDDSM